MIGTLLALPDFIKLPAVALLTFSVLVIYNVTIDNPGVREQMRLQTTKLALERVQEMEKRNAQFENMSQRERCVVLMRSSGLPTSECD